MYQASATWWILFGFIVVFIVLIILLLTGTSFQLVNNLDTNPTVTLGASTSQVLFKSPASGGAQKFVFRQRNTGSTVRLWNTSGSNITLQNDLLNALADTVQVGNDATGVLPTNRTTLCINQNGASSGTGTTGSWRCTEPVEF